MWKVSFFQVPETIAGMNSYVLLLPVLSISRAYAKYPWSRKKHEIGRTFVCEISNSPLGVIGLRTEATEKMFREQ